MPKPVENMTINEQLIWNSTFSAAFVSVFLKDREDDDRRAVNFNTTLEHQDGYYPILIANRAVEVLRENNRSHE